MPRDVTLQVVVVAATHSLETPEKEAARDRVGDIVGAYLTSQVGSPNLTGRLGFIHITGVPDAIPLRKVRDKLLRPCLNPDVETTRDGSGAGDISTTLDPATNPLSRQRILRKRAFRIPPSVLTAALRQELLDNREITVTWAQAKPRIRKKFPNLADRWNRNADDENSGVDDTFFDESIDRDG